MSKNLEELKNRLKQDPNLTYKKQNMVIVFPHLIKILEDHEKRLKVIETELGIYTEEEIEKIKVGGTDPD